VLKLFNIRLFFSGILLGHPVGPCKSRPICWYPFLFCCTHTQ